MNERLGRQGRTARDGDRRVGNVRVLAFVALGGAVALGLAACGNDREVASTPSTSSSTAAPAVTALGSTTVVSGSGSSEPPEATATSVTSPPTVQFPCPAIPPVPSGATSLATIPIDFDGNGTTDTLRVYQVGGVWHVRGEVGGDGFHDQVVTPLGPVAVEPIGAARLNPSDATEEAWVKIGEGAYTDIITIFVFRGCELQRPTLGGNPVELAIGASVGNASGVTCFQFDQGVEVFDTTSTDGVTFTGQSQLYTLDVTSQPAPTLDAVTTGWPMPVQAGNPQAHLSRLTCGSLTYP